MKVLPLGSIAVVVLPLSSMGFDDSLEKDHELSVGRYVTWRRLDMRVQLSIHREL
jgi:hypothetical protein